MGIIKKLGAPTRNLKASIGDIYLDLKTGNKYQCTFSYAVAGSYECDWKLVETNSVVDETPVTKEEVAVEIVEPSVEEKQSLFENDTEVDVTPEVKPQRKNYAKQYQKNNRK